MGRIVSNLILGDGTNYVNAAHALQANDLNWEVVKRSLYARIPHTWDKNGKALTGTFKKADNLYGILRADTLHTLGAVSRQYNVIQNAEGFAPLDTLVDEGGLQIIGAGSMDKGAQVWMQAQASNPLMIGGEAIATSIIAMMRHDGTGSLRFLPSFVRFFCTNQLRGLLNAARKTKAEWAVPIRHASNSKQRIEAARASLKLLVEAQVAFKRTAESLLATPFTATEMRKLAETLIPKPEGPDATSRAMTMWDQRMTAMMKDAYYARDLDAIRPTAWGALNAVADFEQHHTRVTGDDQKRLERLFIRSFQDGPMVRQAVAALIPATR